MAAAVGHAHGCDGLGDGGTFDPFRGRARAIAFGGNRRWEGIAVSLQTSKLPPYLHVPARVAAARAVDAVKIYGSGETAVRALNGLSVEFEKGHFTAIMGPSGSGKSTLLHCLAGLDTLTTGQIYLGDVDVGALDDRHLTKLRRERVGFVFQAFNLIPTLTAGENVVLPLALAGRRPEPEWLERVIAAVGIGDRLRHRPSELSGGQQQRAAAARALVTRPDIVFADEPTGNLDSHASGELLAFMREAVRDLGQTIVMVTHDPLAASHADRVVFLADGAIVEELLDPTVEGILDRMKRLGG
jgi:putative ABC transport system ATP-binding protein